MHSFTSHVARRLAAIIVTAGVVLTTGVGHAQAAIQTFYAAPATAGAADCSSADNACTIDTAVTNTNAADVADDIRIVLADGTYALSAPSPTALVINFQGPSVTIEAASGTPVLDGTNTVRILEVATGSTVTIEGVSFTRGTVSGPGGAINSNGTLTVRDGAFTSNQANNGGAITVGGGSTATVEDSSLESNTTTSVGGGGVLNSGTLNVIRSAFVGNIAPVNGAGINTQGSGTTNITSSTFQGNVSSGLGGAMSNLGTTRIQLSTLIGNSSTGGSLIATGNDNVVLAGNILGTQTSGGSCSPANSVGWTDAGYNLDSDATCLDPAELAAGSHLGTETLGDSTYAAALDAHLADSPELNASSTRTFALLNTPDPATTAPNPAFDMIPADFLLPFAVDGESTACAVADQRGVVAVAGAKCAIGAYRLQPTAIAVTASPETPVQGSPVTYTATIVPAATGGTVAFNDGPGGAATTACGAQPVSKGTATCTVTYTATGDIQVRATYTGDGTGNSFVGSASVARTFSVSPAPPAPVAPAPVTPDTTAPVTRVAKVSVRKQPITLRGTSTDAGGIKRIRVSVARQVGKKCRFLRANGTFGPARSCLSMPYIDATGTTSWKLKLPKLAPGRYMVWSRGIDLAGNVERKDRKRNLRQFRVR